MHQARSPERRKPHRKVMAAKINPRKLRGPWTGGYALDVHTTSSTMIGHNAYGHAVFDTVRSPSEESWGSISNPGDRRGGGRVRKEVGDSRRCNRAGAALQHGAQAPAGNRRGQGTERIPARALV